MKCISCWNIIMTKFSLNKGITGVFCRTQTCIFIIVRGSCGNTDPLQLLWAATGVWLQLLHTQKQWNVKRALLVYVTFLSVSFYISSPFSLIAWYKNIVNCKMLFPSLCILFDASWDVSGERVSITSECVSAVLSAL